MHGVDSKGGSNQWFADDTTTAIAGAASQVVQSQQADHAADAQLHVSSLDAASQAASDSAAAIHASGQQSADDTMASAIAGLTGGVSSLGTLALGGAPGAMMPMGGLGMGGLASGLAAFGGAPPAAASPDAASPRAPADDGLHEAIAGIGSTVAGMGDLAGMADWFGSRG